MRQASLLRAYDEIVLPFMCSRTSSSEGMLLHALRV
jgi:hypothetical protein